MTRADAPKTLIAPVFAANSVHEPVHDLLRPSADASYATLLRAPKADAFSVRYATLAISMYGRPPIVSAAMAMLCPTRQRQDREHQLGKNRCRDSAPGLA